MSVVRLEGLHGVMPMSQEVDQPVNNPNRRTSGKLNGRWLIALPEGKDLGTAASCHGESDKLGESAPVKPAFGTWFA